MDALVQNSQMKQICGGDITITIVFWHNNKVKKKMFIKQNQYIDVSVNTSENWIEDNKFTIKIDAFEWCNCVLFVRPQQVVGRFSRERRVIAIQ